MFFLQPKEFGPSFIQLGICAFRFDNLDPSPECFGFQSSCQFLCCQCASAACKPVKHNRVHAVCGDDVCELVTPKLDGCKCYRQCCCIEFVAGYPLKDAYVVIPFTIKDAPPSFESSPADKLITMNASCCTIDSCFCSLPECVGVYAKGICLICEWERVACKPIFCDEGRANKELLCLCAKQSCMIVNPFLVCKTMSQYCCCYSMAALPCDSDVPCVFTMLPFCTLITNLKPHINCCGTLAQVHEFANANPLSGVPPATQM